MNDEEDLRFLAYVALHKWLFELARKMRDEARVAMAAARRLDPGR
jgi:hypothetical protein